MKAWFLELFPVSLRSRPFFWPGLIVAVVYIVLLVTQLFHYEKMAGVFNYTYNYGVLSSAILAIIVLAELFALPSLLRIQMVHPHFMRFSQVIAWVVPIGWMLIVVRGIAMYEYGNTGLLGTVVKVPASATTLVVLVILYSVAVWYALLGARKRS